VTLLILLPLCAVAQPPNRVSHSGIHIVLKNDFIDRYKDRATIDTTYTVDKAHKTINAPAQDGDMHIAGRAPEVELPIVAEIMNARLQTPFVNLIHQVEAAGKTVKISGAWRLWCEHAKTAPQFQGEKLKPFDTTNPDHVFEIHPITKINDEPLARKSFQPIKGFKSKDAHDAFVNYENQTCQIVPNGDRTEIITHMAGYNYVEFKIDMAKGAKVTELADGGKAVLCAVRDLEGELLVRKARMVFVPETEPFDRLGDLSSGKRLHVLGIPRIDLALVAWRVEHKKDSEFEKDPPLGWNLPYEMIVVGAYPGAESTD
jgi:hypothetical protein